MHSEGNSHATMAEDKQKQEADEGKGRKGNNKKNRTAIKTQGKWEDKVPQTTKSAQIHGGRPSSSPTKKKNYG